MTLSSPIPELSNSGQVEHPLPHPQPLGPVETLLYVAYATLNTTAPNLTESCWLCLSPTPPFYEAFGINATYTVSIEAPRNGWKSRPSSGLTMARVSGQGGCIGTVPNDKTKYCAYHLPNPTWNASVWVTPANGAWWLCSLSGLTPHLAGSVFNASHEYCLTVVIIPKILYHSGEAPILYRSGQLKLEEPHRVKRKPITTLTIATLFGLGLAGAGTGIAYWPPNIRA